MKKMLMMLALVISVTGAAYAEDEGKYADISHDELKQAIAGQSAVILDVNGSESYQDGHIPGAIDYVANKDQIAAMLPAEKDKLIVAYCGSKMCAAYKEAADHAAELGYSNVKHYSGGLAGWKSAGETLEV
jgi:rhodanese-related sulfurtransferase